MPILNATVRRGAIAAAFVGAGAFGASSFIPSHITSITIQFVSFLVICLFLFIGTGLHKGLNVSVGFIKCAHLVLSLIGCMPVFVSIYLIGYSNVYSYRVAHPGAWLKLGVISGAIGIAIWVVALILRIISERKTKFERPNPADQGE